MRSLDDFVGTRDDTYQRITTYIRVVCYLEFFHSVFFSFFLSFSSFFFIATSIVVLNRLADE